MKTKISQQHSTTCEYFRERQLYPLRPNRHLIAGLLVVLSFSCTDTSSAQTENLSPTMRVRVTNYSEATPSTVTKAEHEAGRILGEAGLNVVWTDCPWRSAVISTGPCQQPLEPTNIVLRVLSDQNRNGVPDRAFGVAVLPVLASVYYEHVLSLAGSDGADFEIPIILGCVMAHEIGHLLLGSYSHSDTGIMQGQWDRRHVQQLMKGGLHFTARQSKLIRAEGQTRMSIESTQLRMPSSIG